MDLRPLNLDFKKLSLVKRNGSINYDKVGATIKPGVVLKTKDDELFLVGDVNVLLGICDDCSDFNYEDIVEYADIFDLIEKEKS